MKYVLVGLIGLILFYGCDTKTVYNRVVTQENNKKMLVGTIDKEGLSSEPFSNWYLTNYDSYKPDSALVKELQQGLRLYRIELFMGTWCGDSKREVPRLLKILDEADFHKSRIEMFAVNRKKQSFYGEEIGKDIRRVPTIILYKGNEEVNRIVEYPVGKSLEQDLYTIVSGGEYTPNYAKK